MASSSRRLMLLFLRPMGLDSKTAWVVSGFSMLLTTRVEEKRTQVSLVSKMKPSFSGCGAVPMMGCRTASVHLMSWW